MSDGQYFVYGLLAVGLVLFAVAEVRGWLYRRMRRRQVLHLYDWSRDPTYRHAVQVRIMGHPSPADGRNSPPTTDPDPG